MFVFVCLSVTGLRLKYTGLSIATVAWRSRSRTWRIEDDAKTSPDVWKVVNCSTEG